MTPDPANGIAYTRDELCEMSHDDLEAIALDMGMSPLDIVVDAILQAQSMLETRKTLPWLQVPLS